MKFTLSCSLAFAVVAFSMAGCGGTETDLDPFREATGDAGLLYFQADAVEPLSQGENDLMISIHEASTHTPFNGAIVELSALMPAMAHDAPHAATIEERDGGEYVARGLSLPMAGRWYVEIKASRMDIVDTTKFTYDLR